MLCGECRGLPFPNPRQRTVEVIGPVTVGPILVDHQQNQLLDVRVGPTDLHQSGHDGEQGGVPIAASAFGRCLGLPQQRVHGRSDEPAILIQQDAKTRCPTARIIAGSIARTRTAASAW